MKIETVSAEISIREDPSKEHFTLSVYKTGPDAIPVTEIPILQAMHGMDSVSRVRPFGSYEASRKDEWDRLHSNYKKEHIALVYPTQAAPMPTTLANLHLDSNQMDGRAVRKAAVPENAPPDERTAIRARLAELNFELPFGNFGVEKLRQFLETAEAQAKVDA